MYRSEVLQEGKTTWRLDTADHFLDVIEAVERGPYTWPTSSRESIGAPSYHGINDADKKLGITCWDGTDTLEEALKLARYGWTEGRQLLSASLDAANVAMRTGRFKAEGLDVAGAYPFVPNAVGGDPMCMVTKGLEQAKSKPLFRILVNNAVSWNVTVATLLNRGAGILSWVDTLENAGFPTEVHCLYSLEEYRSGNINKFTIAFPIKTAGQFLSVDRAAFMLAHPAMFRRIGFACYEFHKDLYESGFHSGYGTPISTVPKKIMQPHSIYFPAMRGDNGKDWGTPERAIAAVERHILKALQYDDVKKDLQELELTEG